MLLHRGMVVNNYFYFATLSELKIITEFQKVVIFIRENELICRRSASGRLGIGLFRYISLLYQGAEIEINMTA